MSAISPRLSERISGSTFRNALAATVIAIGIKSQDVSAQTLATPTLAVPCDEANRLTAYPRGIRNEAIAAITPNQALCLTPEQIGAFTDEQWVHLATDAKAMIPVPDTASTNVPENRRRDVLVARQQSAIYLWRLRGSLEAQRNALGAARVSFRGMLLRDISDAQKAAFAYSAGARLAEVLNVQLPPNTELRSLSQVGILPAQTARITTIFSINSSERYQRLPVSGMRLDAVSCAGQPENCTIGRAELAELIEMTTQTASMLARYSSTDPNLTTQSRHVQNMIAVLNAARERFVTVRDNHTDWNAGATVPNRVSTPLVGPVRTVPGLPPAAILPTTVSRTVIRPTFWAAVGGGAAGLTAVILGAAMRSAGESEASRQIAACHDLSARTNAPCRGTYLADARSALDSADAWTAVAFVGAGVVVGSTILAIVERPRTVTTVVPATPVNRPVGPTPHPRRSEIEQDVATDEGVNIGVSQLPGGGLVSVSGSFRGL